MTEPNLILLTGPNGAGKSTPAPDLLHGAFSVDEFVNADVIARGLSALHPDNSSKPRRLVASGGASGQTNVFDSSLWDRLEKEYQHG